MKKRIVFACLTLAMAANASQKTHKTEQVFSSSPELGAMLPYTHLTEGAFKELDKEAVERSHRKIAEAEVSDIKDEDYKQFRDTFLSIKTPEQLDQALANLQAQLKANYDGTSKTKMSTSLQFVGAQIVPLRAYRAIVYKMVKLAEAAHPRAVHSFLLTWVQSTNQFLKVYLPTERWDVLFDYLTQPFTADETQFATVRDMQTFFTQNVIPSLNDSAAYLKKIESDMRSSDVVWDNKILYGDTTFKDNVERFRILRTPDYYAALATLNANLGSAYFFVSYKFTDYFSVLGDLGTLYGIDGFNDQVNKTVGIFGQPVQGAPAFDRRVILMNHRSSFGSYANAKDNMALALKSFQDSFSYSKLAWDEIKGRSTPQDSSILVDLVNPYSRVNDLTMTHLQAMMNGRTPVSSVVTGETIDIDLPGFFSNPPANLTDLLPTGFEDPKKLTKPRVFSDGRTLNYRNYSRGRATTWNPDAYGALFPKIKESKDGKDVQRHARILFQHWGGGLIGLPLSVFIL